MIFHSSASIPQACGKVFEQPLRHPLRIAEQCHTAGVAFFFKQWGGVNKKRTERLLDGRTWDEMPLVV